MINLNVNPENYYEHLKGNMYPEFFQENIPFDEIPSTTKIRQGDVVFDLENKKLAIVLGIITGDVLRLDTDGMQPIENMRPATMPDLFLHQYGSKESHKQLLKEISKKSHKAIALELNSIKKMKNHFTHINAALATLRPQDKVVKILSNKFAIVQAAFEDGKLDSPCVCGLNEDKIEFYLNVLSRNQTIFSDIEEMENVRKVNMSFYANPKLGIGRVWKRVLVDNRNQKRIYRKLNRLL